MKLIISFLLLILLSCEPTSKDEVLNKIEDTKIKIKKKTINKLKENKESKKIIKKNKNIEKNLFHLFILS